MSQSTRPAAHLLKAIRELNVVIDSHARWLAGFHQTMICGTADDVRAMAAEEHHQCAFGQWFHERRDLAEWQDWQEEMAQVDRLHRAIHEKARALSTQRGSGCTSICAGEYHAFTETTVQFKLALRALEDRLADNICLVDQLTGAWNRNSMEQKLTEEYTRMMRNGQPSCLCMMDLDHFKIINDSFGHVAGDRVLQSATDVARQQLRAYDTIFRYGGEEFLICLPNISVDVATAAMDRIRAALADHAVTVGEGTEVRVTASFGVTPFVTDLSIEENIATADRALFSAKSEGRNRVSRLH